MKYKILLLGLCLSTSLFVSCENSETISNKNLYTKYDALYSDVKEVYSSYVTNLSEIEAEGYKDNPYTEIHYTNESNINVNEFKELTYKVNVDENKNPISITSTMIMNVNAEEIKKSGFKFEETPFYELVKKVISKEVDYDIVNEKITQYYLNSDYEYFTCTYSDFSESFILNNNTIEYSLNIKK